MSSSRPAKGKGKEPEPPTNPPPRDEEVAGPSAAKRPRYEQRSASAIMCNALDPELAKELYEQERAQATRAPEPWSKCLYTHRKVKPGDYPRLVIPVERLRPEFEDMSEQDYQALFDGGDPLQKRSDRRVNVHHLAWRSAGHTVPLREQADVKHRCGNGKASTNNPSPCFALGCLTTGTHASNMKEQNCVPAVTCEHCSLVTMVCQHNREEGHHCTSSLTSKYSTQKKVLRVVITYEDGTKETVAK